MSILFVVGKPSRWRVHVPGIEVVGARRYLTHPAYTRVPSVRVFNLCRPSPCLGVGYYVSLLADARGHHPLPDAGALEDLRSSARVRHLTHALDGEIQRALAPVKGAQFDLSIYFGRTPARRHDRLGRRLFDLLQAPLLRARFERQDGQWQTRSIQVLEADDIPPQHWDFAIDAAKHPAGRHRSPHRRAVPPYRLAILADPRDPEPPSNPAALHRFECAAAAQGFAVERIDRNGLRRLERFDALFIRNTTAVDHYTYRFAREAAALGLVVIDDADSILKCCDKVYLAELLQRHAVPTPPTLIVHRGNLPQVIPALGLPCVLKRPDSSFSHGVVRVDSEAQLLAQARAMLDSSALIIAQAWLPTAFDWRVGVLDRKPLFVCKYYMADGHWQVIKRSPQSRCEGPTQAVALADAPPGVIRLALRAANLIGDGLYGVDLKQVGERCYVIEVNDNPNIDACNEDGVLHDTLYDNVVAFFERRIRARCQDSAR